MYVVYRPEDGLIVSTIIGPGLDYGPDVLDKHGQTWLFIEGCTSLDPTTHYVDVATRQLVQFTPISLVANKVEFQANSIDSVTITGIPIGANIAVFCDNSLVANSVSVDGTLTITAAAVATYEIRVSCHRYLPASITIEAVEWSMSGQIGGTLEQSVS